MCDNMNKKIICIGIVSIFLLTSLTTVTAATIKNDSLKSSNCDGLPDLIVVEDSIIVETEKRYDESQHMYISYLIITVTVKNVGNAVAVSTEEGHPDWWTGFWIDDNKLFDSQHVNSLNPGCTKVLTCEEEWGDFNRFKDRKIDVYVDYAEYVEESDELNNKGTINQPISKPKAKMCFNSIIQERFNIFSFLSILKNLDILK